MSARRFIGSASTSMLLWEIDRPLTSLAAAYGFERAKRAYRASFEAVDGLQRLVAELGIACELRQVAPGGWSPRRPQPERRPRTRKGSGVANFQVSVASATLGPSSDRAPAWSVTEKAVSNGNRASGRKVTERLPSPFAVPASTCTSTAWARPVASA